MMTWETIMLLAPAFVAGALISLVHVPLGQEVLRRGIIFLDLAVAQFAALGMIAFQRLGIDEYSWLGMHGGLLSGLAAALACAGLFHVLEKRAGIYQEAFIGCGFVIAASLSLLFVAGTPHGGENIENILAGQILWTDWPDLKLPALVFAGVLCLWSAFASKQRLFYPLFAVTIPFSVNLVGIYLVFASLIIPALAVQMVVRKRQFIAGYLLSVISFAAGLTVSALTDTPAGPMIVCVFAAVAGMFYVLGWKSLKAPNQ